MASDSDSDETLLAKKEVENKKVENKKVDEKPL
jgi:hypothetical protein